MLIIGLILSMVFLAVKAGSVYMSRHAHEEEEDDEEEQSGASMEGGSKEGTYKGPNINDLN